MVSIPTIENYRDFIARDIARILLKTCIEIVLHWFGWWRNCLEILAGGCKFYILAERLTDGWLIVIWSKS
jgi:hypothetical protein